MESPLYQPLLRALSTLFILVLCSLLCLSVSAVDLNDLEVDPITSASEEERLWNVLEYRAEDVCETVTDRIVSFDVNETGWFLLALKGNQLAILDPLGRPVYRYSFAAEGTYYASWNEENILLYFVRGHVLYELTMEGERIALNGVKQSSGNRSLLYNVSTRTELHRNGVDYRVEKEAGIIGFFEGYSYNRLIAVSADGKEKMIVGVSESAADSIVAIWLPALFLVVVPLIIIGGIFIPKILRRKAHHNDWRTAL